MAESITNSLGMALRRIEAGVFQMGSTEPPAKWDEQPVHRVVISGEDGRSTWTQWWPNGRMKARSGWVDFHCDGEASCWDRSGELVSRKRFVEGRMLD